jgi:hypothetical protein
MREIKGFFQDNYFANFEKKEKNCKLKSFLYPFKLLVYVQQTFDRKIVEQFCQNEP